VELDILLGTWILDMGVVPAILGFSHVDEERDLRFINRTVI
jgi:hypothetical protein